MVVSDITDGGVFDPLFQTQDGLTITLSHNMRVDANLYNSNRYKDHIHACQGTTLYTVYRYTADYYASFKYNCGSCFKMIRIHELPKYRFIIDCDPWEDDFSVPIQYIYNYINTGLANVITSYNNQLLFTDRFIYTDNKMLKLLNNGSNVRLPINVIMSLHDLLIYDKKITVCL